MILNHATRFWPIHVWPVWRFFEARHGYRRLRSPDASGNGWRIERHHFFEDLPLAGMCR
ncbi:hypothetical protein HNR03_004901 [Pseudomonas sp. JAI111]|nr:hypothetical protein [Pseudomonas sp. JAI111]